ncbi:hypothetical protein [Maritalea porphyrae]|uniref:hypothetical protein n=1 Tax=Maritalea porphyrae TaxID=880732 RepID=UPI0022AE9C2E|nr:hypothetical protein [Maritalea porphyrae]MCZ4274025.1 hypothetical protein [Maritalea porphyrae]
MKHNLYSTFSPFDKPFPGMDLDQTCQDEIEQRDPPAIADHNVIEVGRQSICGVEKPNEIQVKRRLDQSGLTKVQIERNLNAILSAAGPRFACVLGGVRRQMAH